MICIKLFKTGQKYKADQDWHVVNPFLGEQEVRLVMELATLVMLRSNHLGLLNVALQAVSRVLSYTQSLDKGASYKCACRKLYIHIYRHIMYIYIYIYSYMFIYIYQIRIGFSYSACKFMQSTVRSSTLISKERKAEPNRRHSR